jgi:hypothetical protein
MVTKSILWKSLLGYILFKSSHVIFLFIRFIGVEEVAQSSVTPEIKP